MKRFLTMTVLGNCPLWLFLSGVAVFYALVGAVGLSVLVSRVRVDAHERANTAAPSLVGTWQDRRGGGMTFKADGTFFVASGAEAVMGTYQIHAEKSVVEMTGTGGAAQSVGYRVQGDELTLLTADENGGMQYQTFRRKK